MVDVGQIDDERILEALSLYGVAVVRNFVPAEACASLLHEFLQTIGAAEARAAPTFTKSGKSRFVLRSVPAVAGSLDRW